MSLLNVALWVTGAVLVAVGYVRARPPWSRYQDLRAQDANVARYEAWRGGARSPSGTGASVAMQILRRRVLQWAAVAVVGLILIVGGFVVRG